MYLLCVNVIIDVALQDAVGSFSQDGLAYWLSDEDSEKMLGDQFGLKKIIVIATENGKVSAQTQMLN